MKQYPSIDTGPFDKPMHTFQKIDGSNLRFEWTKKAGWYKSGTRTRLFDESDPVFGCAKELFTKTFDDYLDKIFVNERWERVVVFTEFYGANSFAGLHEFNDEKKLALLDVSVYKKGMLPPAQFVKSFVNVVPTPQYYGQNVWGKEFIDRVRDWQTADEGLVGKYDAGREVIMRKAKSQKWIDRVIARYGEKKAQELI